MEMDFAREMRKIVRIEPVRWCVSNGDFSQLTIEGLGDRNKVEDKELHPLHAGECLTSDVLGYS